jgi:hypothetical protein
MKKTLYILILFFCSLNVSAENPTVFSITELSIKNERFITILDSLIQSERKCKGFSDYLIWKIIIKNTNSNNHQIIEILQTSYRNSESDGFFYLDGILFKVYGTKENILKLFYITENLKIFKREIYRKSASKDELEIWNHPGDDNSAWYYILDNDTLKLKESYQLCQ